MKFKKTLLKLKINVEEKSISIKGIKLLLQKLDTLMM